MTEYSFITIDEIQNIRWLLKGARLLVFQRVIYRKLDSETSNNLHYNYHLYKKKIILHKWLLLAFDQQTQTSQDDYHEDWMLLTEIAAH